MPPLRLYDRVGRDIHRGTFGSIIFQALGDVHVTRHAPQASVFCTCYYAERSHAVSVLSHQAGSSVRRTSDMKTTHKRPLTCNCSFWIVRSFPRIALSCTIRLCSSSMLSSSSLPMRYCNFMSWFRSSPVICRPKIGCYSSFCRKIATRSQIDREGGVAQ